MKIQVRIQRGDSQTSNIFLGANIGAYQIDTICAVTSENVALDVCDQHRFRSVRTYAKCNHNLHYGQFELPKMQSFFMRTRETPTRLHECAGCFVLVERTCYKNVFSRCGSSLFVLQVALNICFTLPCIALFTEYVCMPYVVFLSFFFFFSFIFFFLPHVNGDNPQNCLEELLKVLVFAHTFVSGL